MFKKTWNLKWKVGRARNDVHIVIDKKRETIIKVSPKKKWNNSLQTSTIEKLGKAIVQYNKSNHLTTLEEIQNGIRNLSNAVKLSGEIDYIREIVLVLMQRKLATNQPLMHRLLTQNVNHDIEGKLLKYTITFCCSNREVEKLLILSTWETVLTSSKIRLPDKELCRLLEHMFDNYTKEIKYLSQRHEKMLVDHLTRRKLPGRLKSLVAVLRLFAIHFSIEKLPSDLIRSAITRISSHCNARYSSSSETFFSADELLLLVHGVQTLTSDLFPNSSEHIIDCIIGILRFRVFCFNEKVSKTNAVRRTNILCRLVGIIGDVYEDTRYDIQVFGVVLVKYIQGYMNTYDVRQNDLFSHSLSLVLSVVAKLRLSVAEEMFYSKNAITSYYTSAVMTAHAAWALYRMESNHFMLPVDLSRAIQTYKDDFNEQQNILVCRLLLSGRDCPEYVVKEMMSSMSPSIHLVLGLVYCVSEPVFIEPFLYNKLLLSNSDQALLCLAVSDVTGVILPDCVIKGLLRNTSFSFPEWGITALLSKPSADVLASVSDLNLSLDHIVDHLLISCPESLPFIVMDFLNQQRDPYSFTAHC